MKKNLKRILSLFAVLTLVVTGLVGCGEQKTYEVTLEMGENYVFDAAEIFGVDKEEAAKYEASLETLDTTTAGTYEVKVVKGTKEYTVIYTVEDTKAPEVKMKQKYVFANDTLNVDFSSFVDTKDASKVTEKLCKFTFIEELKVLDEDDVKAYAKDIVDTNDTEALLERLDEVPTKDGVYNAVYVAEDAYGHKTAKEVIVIFDTLAPVIEGVEEISDTVEVRDLEEEWTETFVEELHITDNCDGVIKPEALDVKMEKTDDENHTYKVSASYTDRAGNKTTAEYSFSLKERKSLLSRLEKENEVNGGTAGSSGGSTGGGSSTVTDADGDGVVDSSGTIEINGFLFNTENVNVDTINLNTALANAGYYNPIAWNNGCFYMIVPYGEDDAGVEYLWTWMSNQGLPFNGASGGPWDINRVAMMVCAY